LPRTHTLPHSHTLSHTHILRESESEREVSFYTCIDIHIHIYIYAHIHIYTVECARRAIVCEHTSAALVDLPQSGMISRGTSEPGRQPYQVSEEENEKRSANEVGGTFATTVCVSMYIYREREKLKTKMYIYIYICIHLLRTMTGFVAHVAHAHPCRCTC